MVKHDTRCERSNPDDFCRCAERRATRPDYKALYEAEKAARKVSERDLIESRARAAGLSDLAGEHKAAREEAERKFEQQVEFRREYERIAEKAEQEREEIRSTLRAESRIAQDYKRRAQTAEARVTELEARIARLAETMDNACDPYAGDVRGLLEE